MIRVVSDHAAIRGDGASKQRQNLGGDIFPVPQAFKVNAAERRPLLFLVHLDEFTHLIDGADAIQVTLSLTHPPGEQSVTTQDDTVSSRIVSYRSFNQQCQLKSWTLPWNPNDLSIKLFVKFFELLLAVGT